MAGDSFRKRHSGDPFVMKAPLYNALIDTTRLAKQNQHDVRRAAKQEFRQTGIILVRNDSEDDRERFDILGLEEPVISPTDNLEEFQRQVVMSGVVPRCPDHDGRFAILLEPILKGEFGKAVVSGVVQCQITVDDEWFDFADILDGRAGVLGSVDLGSARILWKEEGTGTKWAIVRLSNPQDVTACSSTSTTAPPTSTTGEPPTTTTGEDPTTSGPSTTTGEQQSTTTGEQPTSTTGSPTTGEDTTTTGEAPTTTTGDETTGEGTTTTDSGTTGDGTTTTGGGTSTTDGGTTDEGTSTTGDETTAEGTTTTDGGTTTTGEPLSTTTGPEGTSTTDDLGTTTTESGTSTTPELTTTTDEAPCVVYVPTLSIDGCLLTIPKATLHIVNGRIVCEPAGDDVVDLSECCGCGTSTSLDSSTTVIEEPVTTTAELAITTEELSLTTDVPVATTEEPTITTEIPSATTAEVATTSGDVSAGTTPEEGTTTT